MKVSCIDDTLTKLLYWIYALVMSCNEREGDLCSQLCECVCVCVGVLCEIVYRKKDKRLAKFDYQLFVFLRAT